MPLLGFGVFQNYKTKASVLEAFQAGYRFVITKRNSKADHCGNDLPFDVIYHPTGILIVLSCIRTKRMSVQHYRKVG
jgi:hypothetical protein